jgi:hypothetical protein
LSGIIAGEGVAEGIIVEEWGYSCWRSCVTEGQGGPLSGDTVVGEGVAAEGTVGGIKLSAMEKVYCRGYPEESLSGDTGY